ncbi:ribonucleotide-diphosphate reductase subunit beta, partial [Klebsiella pneumoniae]|nr:ribonucleotide-diphosphate reductase subunit beta [Klebsiella pneumoniae]
MPAGQYSSTGLTSMAYTTFSQTKNDQLLEPMFFGQPVNVARYDQQKYDIFEKLIE